MAEGNRNAGQDQQGKGLTKREKYGRIKPDGRWISCPACGNARLLMVREDARAYRVPVYCKRCRGFVEINID